MRKPALAGSFYPADKSSLINQINNFLAKAEKIETNQQVSILIVPHAGYDYSGQTAAWAYKQIKNQSASRWNQKIILLGCSHQAYFNYAAVDNQNAWQTPLGQVKINAELASSLILAKGQSSSARNQSGTIKLDFTPHRQEHSLEVQLPFLQTVLKNFEIVPILLGQINNQVLEDLVQAINNNFDEKTLLIISSDLCHYPNAQTAKIVDGETINAILTGKVEKFSQALTKNTGKNGVVTCACAAEAIKVGMMVAEKLGIKNIQLLNYTNSAVMGGDKNQVVGYSSIGFYFPHKKQATLKTLNKTEKLNQNQQKQLLQIARNTLESYLKNKKIAAIKVAHLKLQQKMGAFVTLTKNGKLRGCIGEVETQKPLYQTVKEKVIDAAFNDPRFEPIKLAELAEIKIEISVLSPLEKINDWRQIKLGQDGVLIREGFRAGLFLPQVALETGWNLETFLQHLCTGKAGLEKDAYKDPKTQIYIFKAQVFSE
jgi:AmmeMemoRadiSam system protein B/AmmeMemoRadiSam system protein A